MEDVEQTTDAFEGIEFGLLLGRESTGLRFGGKFIHARMIALGKPELEQGVGGSEGKVREFDEPLAIGRAGVGSRGFGFHTKDCSAETAAKEGFFAERDAEVYRSCRPRGRQSPKRRSRHADVGGLWHHKRSQNILAVWHVHPSGRYGKQRDEEDAARG
jgi:hypothetical protein